MTTRTNMHLHSHLWDRATLPQDPTRKGFGLGFVEAATHDERIWGVCADLTESTQMNFFAEKFPDRFVQVGVAEQNLVTVASGIAAEGKIPFASAYATFSPGRNWEQIRTTICYNDRNVKVIGSHTGLTVGPDGATHQALEDLAIMRVLPNMDVVYPCDREQARKATHAIACTTGPAYLRLAREKSPVFTTTETPFILGRADVYISGSDLTLIACGPLVYEALSAAYALRSRYSIEVINVHTLSPFDVSSIVRSARKTKHVITIEEHQIIGGLGSAVAEALTSSFPCRVDRIGLQGFGESGDAQGLWKKYGLDAKSIARRIEQLIRR